MRRSLAFLVATLLIPALSAGGQDTGQYRDDFGDFSYSGSDGNLDWVAEWVESGENDGPTEGAVRVRQENCENNKCLHIDGNGLVPNLAISRKADLSEFAGAELSYFLFVDSALLSTATLTVEARGGGSGWTELARYLLLTEGGEHHDSIDMTEYKGADFEIRFRLLGLIGGDLVTVDRVVVEGTLQSPSTTSPTSTTSTTSTTIRATTTTTRGEPGATSAPEATSTAVSSTTPRPESTSTKDTEPATASSSSTSSTSTSTTTTTLVLSTASGPPDRGRALEGGLRESGVGLLADYRDGMMGDLDMNQVEVLGVTVDADFSMAVEVFRAARVWIAAIALIVSVAVLIGVDRRRRSASPDS